MPVLHLHHQPRLQPAAGSELPLSARESALLAWLHLQGPTARARLAGLLWPAGSEAQARANLRQTLARLKRTAGPVLDEADGLLRLAADVAVAPPPEAAAPLLGALAFDDAPEFAEWLAARRDDALRSHQRETLAAARTALAQGELDAALAAADAVLATHPETEEAWRLRMEAFHRRGDRAAALQAWDDCRHALRSAFGVAPAAETQALGRQLLQDEPPPAAARHAGSPGSPASPAALPPALRRPPQLLGRDALLAALRTGLALGQGAVVLGPGGIGKSRLLAELALRAGPALAVGARPGDAPRAGALVTRLVAQALRRFEPELDAATRADLGRLLPLDPGAPAAPGTLAPADLRSALEHRRVLGAVTRLLQACHGRGMRVVIVDDLQFADEASLEALQVLVGAWRDTPPEDCAPPLLAARGDELGEAGQALLDLLAGSGRAARHELAPLDSAQVRQLLDDVLPPATPAAAPAIDRDALAEALQARVGGNPAFLVESLKGLWQCGLLCPPAAAPGSGGWRPGQPLPIPPTLLEAVRLRLQRLGPEALQMAQLAAVAQSDFSLALAAGAFGRSALALAPVLAELTAAQVFDGQAFAHDLLADAVQRTLPPALAVALHRLVAEQLMTRLRAAGGADAVGLPASIAVHLDAAGEPHAAAPWRLQAAAQARARWQMSAAAGAYEAAARALAAPRAGATALAEADRRAALLAWRDAARCRQWAAQHEGVGQALAAAEPLARGDGEQALLHVVRTAWLFGRHRFVEAVQAAGALMDALDRLKDAPQALAPIDQAYAVRALASAVPYGADMARALHHAGRAEAALQAPQSAASPAVAAREADEARLVLHTARAGLLHWNAQPLPAVADLDRAEALSQATADEGARFMVLNQRMRVRHALGDLPGALDDANQLWTLASRLEVGPMQRADVLHVRGMVCIAAGRPAEGAAHMAAMAALLAQSGLAPSISLRTSMALAQMNLGRLDAAAEALGPPPDGAGPGNDLLVMAWQLTRARLALRRGEPAGAHLAAAAAITGLPPGLCLQRDVALASLGGPVVGASAVEPGAAAAVAVPADVGPCAALGELQARVAALGLRGMARTVALAWAGAALAAGQPALALRALERALALGEAVDAWLDEPATGWLTAAEVFAALGDAPRAAEMAALGRAWVQDRAEAWGADEAARQAWLHGHPLHRRLLCWGATSITP